MSALQEINKKKILVDHDTAVSSTLPWEEVCDWRLSESHPVSGYQRHWTTKLYKSLSLCEHSPEYLALWMCFVAITVIAPVLINILLSHEDMEAHRLCGCQCQIRDFRSLSCLLEHNSFHHENLHDEDNTLHCIKAWTWPWSLLRTSFIFD